MNRSTRIGCGLMLLVAAGTGVATAEGLRSLNLGVPGPVSGSTFITEDSKREYLSQGQEYLRTYLRSSVRRMLQTQGVAVDLDQAQTGAAFDLTSWYSQHGDPRISTHLQVSASDDLSSYLTCGRQLPVRIELDSAYQMMPELSLQARFDAPFDDLFRMELGTRYQCAPGIDARLATSLCRSDRLCTELAAGVEVAMSSWRLDLECRLNPDSVLMQRLNLGTTF